MHRYIINIRKHMKLSTLTFAATLPAAVALWYILLPSPAERPSQSLMKKVHEQEKIEATHAMEAMRWYNNQRAYPTGTIPVDWREKARAAVELLRQQSERK